MTKAALQLRLSAIEAELEAALVMSDRYESLSNILHCALLNSPPLPADVRKAIKLARASVSRATSRHRKRRTRNLGPKYD